MNKKGLTLVESMVALAAAGTITAAVLSSKMEDFEKSKMLSLLHDASTITLAVDHRIAIDGYSMKNWGSSGKDNTLPLSWTNINTVMNDLILEELVSKDSNTCKGGEWEPKLSVEKETKLLDCNLWNKSQPEGFNIRAELIPDSNGFINEFHTILSFKNEDSFRDNYQNLKYAVNNFNVNNKQFIKGHHKTEFVSLSTGESILTTDCIANFANCGVKIGFKINLDPTDDGYFGGEEFVRIDGGNSIIGNNLTFMKSGLADDDAEAPYKCLEWGLDSSGDWVQKKIGCGIGLYKGTPTTVSVNTKTATFNEHVTLRNECRTFEKDSANTIKEGDKVPCAIVKNKDGGVEKVIQVVERYVSEMAYFKELYSNKGYFDAISEVSNLFVETANINDLIVDTLNVDTLTIMKDLIAEDGSLVEFNGDTIINGTATFKEHQNFNSKVVFEKDLEIKSSTGAPIIIDGNLNIDDPSAEFDSLTIDGYMTVSKNVNIGNLEATNLTAKEIKLNNLDTDSLSIRSDSTLASNQKIKANTGDFENINTEINRIKHYVDNDIYVVQNKEDSYDGWSNTGGLHSCSSWTPSASSKPKGQAFTQTRSCKQNQIRNQHFYELWKNAKGVLLKKEHIGSKQHAQQVSIPQSRTAVGTKSTSSGGNSCHSKCLGVNSRDQYQQCMTKCSNGGSGGGHQCGANGCGLGNAGGHAN
jgi:hypothetical protein